MDLPKEIRLQVYEHLPIKTDVYPLSEQYSYNYDNTGLASNFADIGAKKKTPHVALVSNTISGLEILATCHEVHEEAQRIFRLQL
ncbi:hypothetical protein P280DRAFT_468410, partial [Massarina eburnea CBS 473.64]